jgi:hypothetical protein
LWLMNCKGDKSMEEVLFVSIVGLAFLLVSMGFGLWINSLAEQGKSIFG